MIKNALIYIRVSDPSQVDNNSLESQEDICRKYASSKGYEVVKVFREEGISGKTTNRKALQEMLKFCSLKKNLIDAVIVYKLIRLSRSTEDGLAIEAYLSRKGIQVLSATEPLSHDPIGKFNRTILYAVGQLDNEIKGEMVRDNMKAVFRKGIWCWRLPPGYKRPFTSREENRGQPPILHPQLSPIIKNLFQEACKGIFSKQQLADKMNLQGFKDFYGRVANVDLVTDIASNTFYHGLMYAKKWNEHKIGIHEPIISEELWQKANIALFGGQKKYRHQDNSIYPLKGLIKCEICHRFMTSSNPKGRSRSYTHYECNNKACRGARIATDEAHKQFLELLKTIKPTNRVLKIFIHMVFNEWDKVINAAKSEIESIDKRIEHLQQEIKRVSTDLNRGIYNEDQAKGEADGYNQEMLILKVKRSDVKTEQYNAEKISNFMTFFFLNFDRLWLRIDDLPMKQALQRKIFPNGVLCTKNKEIRTAGLSPSFELIGSLSRGEFAFGEPRQNRTVI